MQKRLTKSDKNDIIPLGAKAPEKATTIIYGRRSALYILRGHFCPRKGGSAMFVTYEAMFAFAMFVVTFAAFVIEITRKK